MRQVMENCKLSGVDILELSFRFNLQVDFSAIYKEYISET